MQKAKGAIHNFSLELFSPDQTRSETHQSPLRLKSETSEEFKPTTASLRTLRVKLAPGKALSSDVLPDAAYTYRYPEPFSPEEIYHLPDASLPGCVVAGFGILGQSELFQIFLC